jgi:hypothetical protein
VYRAVRSAPMSRVPADKQGARVARFCKVCRSFYPLHAARHVGKPLEGRDHIASPCTEEGRPFLPGEDWWEYAVELLEQPIAKAS